MTNQTNDDVGLAVSKYKQLVRAERRKLKLNGELGLMLAKLSDSQMRDYIRAIDEYGDKS